MRASLEVRRFWEPWGGRGGAEEHELQGSQCPLPQLSLWPAAPPAPPRQRCPGRLCRPGLLSPPPHQESCSLRPPPLLSLCPSRCGFVLPEVLFPSLHGVCVGGGVQSDARAAWGSKKTQGFIRVVYSGQKNTFKMRLVKLPSKPDVPGTIHGCAGTRDVYLVRFLPYSESLANLHEPEYPPRTRG